MREGKDIIFYKRLVIFTVLISLIASSFVLTPEANKSSLEEFKSNEDTSKKLIFSYTVCADPVYVDDDYAGSSPGDIVDGHTFGYDAFDKIQDGVDGVCDGGTIYVYSGTYSEQVYITTNVDMFGIVSTVTKPLIQPPLAASRTTYTIPESTRLFDPIIFADGGAGTIDITISNFEIDGLDDGGSNTFCGMLLRNTASGPINSKWIKNNDIHSLWGTGQETMGIIMYGSNTDKIVHGNTVSGFSRNGITAIDGVVSINSNIVTGNGPLPTGNWAQNGIQVSGGATGNVIGNTVSGCSILNPNWAASGILCYLSSGSVNVNSNDIIENEVNVYLASCSADVRGNTVYATGAGTGQTYFYGIVGDPGEGTPTPAPSPYIDDYIADKPVFNPIMNTITYYMICQSNNVESDDSSGGIGIGCYAGMYGTYDIYLTIDNNDILNWDTGIELYEYAPNIIAVANIHCNNIIGNTYGIYNWLTKTFNANCNWWGDISGPYHPISNPTGLGDTVSDFIDFVPWTGTVIAEAGGPYEDNNCDYTITFDGSSSYVYCPCDPETLSYSWDFDDTDGIQVDSTEMSPTHTYPTFGEYTATLTVTGSIYGGTNVDSATVKIYGAIADAGGPYYIQDSLKVKFDGSGSTGFEAPLTYDWDFGDGSPHGTGVTPIHTYSDYRTYTVTLTVTESGNSCFDTDTTTVHFQRDPPTVVLIYPEGGETLKGTIKVEWWAHDTQDEYELPIYIYYQDEINNWYQINGILENTEEYMWDTTSLPDGTYRLLVEAVDSDNNIGHDESEPFEIKNHEEPPSNNPPNKPSRPSGKINGIAGNEYTYTSSTTDNEGDQMFYKWDWGDGETSGWLGPYTSGETCDASHIWEFKDDYSIRVKARDKYGSESSWSDPLSISMPVYKHINNPLFKQILNRLIERFPVIALYFKHF